MTANSWDSGIAAVAAAISAAMAEGASRRRQQPWQQSWESGWQSEWQWDSGSKPKAARLTKSEGVMTEPVISFAGPRTFSGSSSDFENLADRFTGSLGPAFSVAFSACWDSLNAWSRIIDFGNGSGVDNIFICNRKKTGDLAFNIWVNRKEHCTIAVGAIKPGETHRYLCSVSAAGLVQIWCDGHLLTEKQAAAPRAGSRKSLLLGKSNWEWDEAFCGSIENLCVWNNVVTWDACSAGTPSVGLQGSCSQAGGAFAQYETGTLVDTQSSALQALSNLLGRATGGVQETNKKVGSGICVRSWSSPGSTSSKLVDPNTTRDSNSWEPLSKSWAPATEKQNHEEGQNLEKANAEGADAISKALKRCATLRCSFDPRFFAKVVVAQMFQFPFRTDVIRLTLNMAILPDSQAVPVESLVQDRRGGGSGDTQLPHLGVAPDFLRGLIQYSDASVGAYFSHFSTLLHLEVLHELVEIRTRLGFDDWQLMQRGAMLKGLWFKDVSSTGGGKKNVSLLPGRGTNVKKSLIVFRVPNPTALTKLRLIPGDSVLISRSHPNTDLLGEGLIVRVPKDDCSNEIAIGFDKEVETWQARTGTWRLDKGPNRVVYERQFGALVRLATAGKRKPIWDLLLMTSVGGSNVDGWAKQMLEKVKSQHEGPALEPHMEQQDIHADEQDMPTGGKVGGLPPKLIFAGREFEGTAEDYEDLAPEFGDVVLGPNLTISFTACWHSFKWWSRVVDFGNGPDDCNVFIANQKNCGTLCFHVYVGQTEYRLAAHKALDLGETCNFRCTISDKGHMRIYKDNLVLAERFDAAPPMACARERLLVAKSNWDRDEPFHGAISNLRAWDAVVDDDGVPATSLPAPLIEYPGRTFKGDNNDFEDLAYEHGHVCLFKDGFSVQFRACWYRLHPWSRIIDFGNGPDNENIFIANKGKTGALAFHVFSGKREFTLHTKDVIKEGAMNTYLCTVTAEGHMRAYQDGFLIGENDKGAAPTVGTRRRLLVGKSNWDRDDPFYGWINDLRVWNGVIENYGPEETSFCQISDPVERLNAMSSSDVCPNVAYKKTLQRLRESVEHGEEGCGLNTSQQRAVMQAVGRRLSLVQGPPGTGKTHVSVRILQFWAQKLGIRPILATSDSNIAVDNLAEGALGRGLKVVRVGRPEKATEAMQDVVLDHLLRKKKQDYKNQQQLMGEAVDFDEGEWNSQWDYAAKMKLINEADVICCTTVGSGSNFLKSLEFGAILIDEAAQATELSAVVPLVLCGGEQLVLVGDHCQLPPSIASFEAELRGLSLSLFGRFAAQGVSPFFLDTQFRMHPMIAAFSAQEFYNGRLGTGIDESERPAPAGFGWPSPAGGIAFIHVQSAECSDGQSKANQGEAAKVAEVLAEVMAAEELSLSEIGIVSPYSSQVRLLRQQLRTGISAADSKSLEIASVDAFQGREKELIIFSAVRSNPHGNVGFLADWRRLNVMITRARRGLIIIGDTTTLKANETWCKWLMWAEENHLFHY